MAIEIAWRSLRLRSRCSGVSPMPITGSSMLKPMIPAGDVRKTRQAEALVLVLRRRTSSESCIATR